jgi:NAD(P)-dependent dehydrogenase (short-subunit alcohol dehydrogenase family)
MATMRTPTTAPLLENADLAKRVLQPSVIRRFGEPSDAAAAVLFLVSNEPSLVTAQTYPVNGGYSVSS